jgi:hypothetical protein
MRQILLSGLAGRRRPFCRIFEPAARVMKITHNLALSFHPIFIPLNQLFGVILDLGFWIADLLYRFALSFFIKLIRRRRTLNPNSKIQYPKCIWLKLKFPIP